MNDAADTRIRLSRRARHTILTVHIAASVALLGDVLGLAAIALRARDEPPAAAATAGEIMSMMSFLFGIPLSLIALITGVVLGVGTRWGILRHWWVTVKLVALIAVMAVGALVVGPAEGRLSETPTDASPNVIVIGAVVQAGLLVGATALSVFKPGRRRGAAGRRTVATAA
jgi:hypothetical protein